MRLINERVNELIEEINREKQRAHTLNAVKQRFVKVGKNISPKTFQYKDVNNSNITRTINPVKQINPKYHTTLSRKISRSTLGRLYKYGKLEATNLKDKAIVVKDALKGKDINKYDIAGEGFKNTAKTFVKDAISTAEGAAERTKAFVKGATRKEAGKTLWGKAAAGFVAAAKDAQENATVEGSARAARFAALLGGNKATKAAIVAGTAAYHLSKAAIDRANLSNDEVIKRIQANVDAKQDQRSKDNAAIRGSSDPKSNDYRYGYVERIEERDKRVAESRKRNPAEEAKAEIARKEAREAVDVKDTAEKKAKQKEAVDNEAKQKAAATENKAKQKANEYSSDPDTIAAIRTNDNAIEMHKQHMYQSKTPTERQEHTKKLTDKLDMKNLTPEHKDYLRQSRIMESISESINNLIEEVSQGYYYGRAARKAVGQNLIRIIKHPTNSKNYQKLSRSFKMATKYNAPVKQVLSGIANKLKTNISDAGSQTVRDMGDDIASVASAAGRRVFDGKNPEADKRAVLGGARIASYFGGPSAMGAVAVATGAYNLGKEIKKTETLSNLSGKYKTARSDFNTLRMKSTKRQEQDEYDKNQVEINKRKEELKNKHGIHM